MMPNLTLAEPVGLALSWMVTYLIHSTILILGVWLLCRGIKPVARRIGPGAENLAWKLAIVGGFVTASIQIGAGVRPALGAFEISTAASEVAAAERPALAPTPAPEPTPIILDQDGELVMLGVGPSAPAGPAGAASLALRPPAAIESAAVESSESPAPPVWPFVVLGVWALGVAIAGTRLLLSVRALRRRLADREEVIVDPVLETFLTLCRDAEIGRKIRLTQSARVSSPLALWRREIVVPERAVEQLSPTAMRSVLAHELAHLERRDPHWLALAAVLEVLCFFQPLNRLARRGMQESAELLCDDWAIGQTKDAVVFAKSLAELASWSHAEDRSAGLVAGMVSGEGPLVRRVRRALDGDPRRFDDPRVPRTARVLLGLGTLAALVMVAPGAVDASGPRKAANEDETRAERKARKAREKAEKDAAKAEERARKAREKAEAAEREADEARRRAEQAQAEAEAHAHPAPLVHPGDRSVGAQHLIIRDGDEYLIIDANGVRIHSDEAEVEIIDGHNPRMRMRIHDGDVNLDLDVDLDTLESMTNAIIGGLIGESFGAPMPGMGIGGPMSAEELGVYGGALEREILDEMELEQLERELEAQARELEAQARELERRQRERERHHAPRPPGAPPAPVTPQVAPPAPPAPPAPIISI